MPAIPYWQAVRDALREEMLRDDKVILMGEDIGIYGGAYGATRDLYDEFGPERVRDTAISEEAIPGAACGAAMCGWRPVAEIMYFDFMTLATDQFVNQAAKNRYMFGGKTTVPMVLRTEGGTGRCIAAQHSQSLEAWFTHAPGVLVVAPATPYDVKGLLKSAIRDDNPVLFIEHKMLYKTEGEVPDEDYHVPLGEAVVRRQGTDVTLVSYSRCALHCEAAAAALAEDGIEAEVIDIRSLKPLDMPCILHSVQKTGRVVLVSEGYNNTNFVCEIAMRINEHGFDFLDAPPARVCGADAPIPMAPTLEDACVPTPEKIAAQVKQTLEY